MVVQEGSEERVGTNDVEERVNGGGGGEKGEQVEDEKEEGDATDSPEEAQLELDRSDSSIILKIYIKNIFLKREKTIYGRKLLFTVQ